MKKKSAPIRVVVRCAWSGARLPVPTTASDGSDAPLPPLRGASTLLDVVLRLESALPPSLLQGGGASSAGAALVCLRKTVPQSRWETTTLKQMLDGDDGSAGVLLTLDLAGGASGAGGPAAREADPVARPIAAAAASLNIRPVAVAAPAGPAAAPVRVAATSSFVPDDHAMQSTAGAAPETAPSPEAAWAGVLQSNFDAATKDCLTTLLKIIDNLLSRPNDPKVRSIRCANAAFHRKVGCCAGGYEFLSSVGFVPTYPVLAGGGGGAPETLELPPRNESRETLLRGRRVLARSAVEDLGMAEDDVPPAPATSAAPPSTCAAPPPATGGPGPRGAAGAGFDVYKARSHNLQSAAAGAPDPYGEAAATTSATERQLQRLAAKKDKLEREMQSVRGDRGLVAYRAGSGPSPTGTAPAAGNGGHTDSSLVAARMRKMEEERKKREEGGFTTKAMRDLERMKKAKVYSHAQIRMNFPDGTHLHGRFLPRERVAAVRAVVREALRPALVPSLDFDLYVAPPRRVLDDARTLEKEDLVPAARIHVGWRAGASPAGGAAPGAYLRPELFAEGEKTAAAAFPEAKPLVKTSSAQKNATDANSNDRTEALSKEELLMQRMLGKKGGMFSKKGGMFGGKKKS